MKQETDLMYRIAVALSEKGCIIHRTNSGLYYTRDGRPVRIGEVGMSDLQGHRPDGKAFYLEVKTYEGKKGEAQKKFIAAMERSGAIAGFVRSIEESLKLVFKEEANNNE